MQQLLTRNNPARSVGLVTGRPQCPLRLRACGRRAAPRRRHGRAAGCARRLSAPVCTSEHWWEDEEEFDSLTDSIKPKNLLLVVPPAEPAAQAAAVESLRAALGRVVFHTAVSSAEALDFGRRLWAGRDGPPYFHKVRSR